MNPHCKIVHYCDNVMKPEFGVPFVSKFDIVMNALDNLGARRHMNRLCLAADKPLIESGTTGYLGQVSVHLPHKTECFECTEKPTPKTYLAGQYLHLYVIRILQVALFLGLFFVTYKFPGAVTRSARWHPRRTSRFTWCTGARWFTRLSSGCTTRRMR